MGTAGTMLVFFLKGVDVTLGDYSLPDVQERLYENQLALEGTLMGLTLQVEEQETQEVSGNVRGALWTTDENTGHIKQGLALVRRHRNVIK